jgi:hypothetical protein
MKTAFASRVSKSSCPLQKAVVLFLLFTFVVSACGASPATETPIAPAAPTTSVPTPPLAIVTGGPCEMDPGGTVPLSVTGMPGIDVVYTWTASAGNVNPHDKAAVTYTAPSTPQDVIITVMAQKGDVASDATIKCKVIGSTQTPVNTPTLAPTLTPSPVPTSWACTSYRSQKLEDENVPGEVKIINPKQGTADLPSGKDVQVAGSYAGLPVGKYLWIFIYSADAGQHGRYYPQTRSALNGWQPEPTTGPDGGFTLKVNFGAPKLCYELIVMLADAEASQSIADQLMSGAAVNFYTGYELNGPSTAESPNAPGLPGGLVEKASIEVKTK